MGVQPYMLAPALNLVCAQRLVRKLCTCATKRDATYAESEEIKAAVRKINDVKPKLKLEFDGKVPTPVGCEKCNGE
jgi:type II secretory ATPase GspE/PulE/Tfp pilus assembly ATPase PilB-like protein